MRILIAEDSVLLRAGIARLLTDAGHEIVAAVPDASGLLAAVVSSRMGAAASATSSKTVSLTSLSSSLTSSASVQAARCLTPRSWRRSWFDRGLATCLAR